MFLQHQTFPVMRKAENRTDFLGSQENLHHTHTQKKRPKKLKAARCLHIVTSPILKRCRRWLGLKNNFCCC